jgi:glycosyltransferase involved in cell wall biosynthesis
MSSGKLSIIIPSRNEQFLGATVSDILAKATGEIEVIVVLDGGDLSDPWFFDQFADRQFTDERVRKLKFAESRGTRAAINAGVETATGEFILKTDAHCLFDEGFDEKIVASCFPNHVVVPRRKRLDPVNWMVEETTRPDCDYEYIQWHPTDFGGRGHNIVKWDQRNADETLRDTLIDDLFCMQASCWSISRDYFHSLDLMDESTYGKTQNEGEEIAFKCWLSGGRVVINKTTWYAHLWKGTRYPRDYQFEKADLAKAVTGVQKWLTNSAWDKQTLPFSWLIEKFNPPGWPTDWREQVNQNYGRARDLSVPHGEGHSNAAVASVSSVDERSAASGRLSANGPVDRVGSVLSATVQPVNTQSTLERVLRKFNLDPAGDYSHRTMPINLRNFSRTDLAKLFADLGFNRGAEIGTAAGEYAETLCKANPALELSCVDLWAPYPGYRDYKRKATLDGLFAEAKDRLAPYDPYFVRSSSTEAAAQFCDQSLNFTYIDCNHKFEYVVADIAAWLPKVRSGGIIAGHDFIRSDRKQFGVIEAVTGWCSAYKVAPWFVIHRDQEAPYVKGDNSPSWFWVKP